MPAGRPQPGSPPARLDTRRAWDRVAAGEQEPKVTGRGWRRPRDRVTSRLPTGRPPPGLPFASAVTTRASTCFSGHPLIPSPLARRPEALGCSRDPGGPAVLARGRRAAGGGSSGGRRQRWRVDTADWATPGGVRHAGRPGGLVLAPTGPGVDGQKVPVRVQPCHADRSKSHFSPYAFRPLHGDRRH